ncbi:hypothetical protein E2C01_065757 [Portunus trituberculatus]|uniref:Uncharacterized protein n=1 Tax=Portunus trituberculatus TaxID=210409 RepID=A0A5B7HP65_PORTR|nr:hypothetical protein [Portunus trituberculatus]
MSSFEQLQKQAATLGLSGTDALHYITSQQAYEWDERASVRQEQREEAERQAQREEAERQAQREEAERQEQREEVERQERLELA